MKYTVRVIGTSPVWADITIEAATADEAREKARATDPRFSADWQLSEGNGVDDWEFAEVFDAQGEIASEGMPRVSDWSSLGDGLYRVHMPGPGFADVRIDWDANNGWIGAIEHTNATIAPDLILDATLSVIGERS